MIRAIALALCILSLAVPASPKTKDVRAVKGVYPVSCDDLWVAVKDTLGNKSNYSLASVNDLDLHASFIVVGDLILYTDRVTLYQKNGGCAIREEIKEVGAENPNTRAFNSRLEKSLERLQMAKAAGASKPADAKSSAEAQHQ